jgi:hypothetical protein
MHQKNTVKYLYKVYSSLFVGARTLLIRAFERHIYTLTFDATSFSHNNPNFLININEENIAVEYLQLYFVNEISEYRPRSPHLQFYVSEKRLKRPSYCILGVFQLTLHWPDLIHIITCY